MSPVTDSSATCPSAFKREEKIKHLSENENVSNQRQ
jgi:hypothetical protein